MNQLTLCELEPGQGLESHSPFCLKVHRALRAEGLAYTSRHGKLPSDFRHLNPKAQVPVLLDGDRAIPDSTAILRHVAKRLLPQEPRAQAEAWLWEDFADRSLNGYLVAARWLDDRNWPLVRKAYFGKAPWPVRAVVPGIVRRKVRGRLAARDVGTWDDFRETLDLLEKRAPAKGFWVSSTLSVADVSLFAQLQSLRTPLTAWQARELELRPALVDYLDRVDAATAARPTVVRMVA